MRIFVFILFVSYWSVGYGQSGRTTVDPLEDLIKKKDYRELGVVSEKAVAKFRESKQIDSLITYAYYEGMAICELKGFPAAQRRMVSLIENDIEKQNAKGDQIADAYLMAANLFAREGYQKDGYALLQKLLKNPVLKNKTKDLQYRIESTMGTFSMGLGQFSISSNHFRQSLKLFPHEKTNSDEYFIVLNSMGIAMYQSSKLDSSIYYFTLAKDFIKHLDESPVNQFYRSGMIDGNISNVYAEKGETNISNQFAEQAIEKYRKFLSIETNYPQKPAAQRNLFSSLDNLAATLLESGDYLKAKNLYTFSLTEKQKFLGENDPGVYKSYIALAGVSLSREENAKAINYAEKSLTIIRNIGDTNTLYDAEAYSKLAQAWYKKGDTEKAAYYYQKAYKILDQLNGEEYSIQYLDFLDKYALFKANVNDGSNAETLADKGLRYSLKTNPQYSLPVAMQLLNQVNVHLQLKKYSTSLEYSEKAIQTFDKLISNAQTGLDSIRFENFKASAILGKSKSSFYLLKEKNLSNIQKILSGLRVASDMFERRKLYFSNDEDVSLTIESYREINDFINLLQLDLYKITGDKSYLNAIVQKNESLVYTRFKRALNNRQLNVQFKGVPAFVQKEEAEIKELLAEALKNNKSETGSINTYFKQTKRWSDFLMMLKKDYPDYYKARYGSEIEKSISGYTQEVPKESQVVRFYLINEQVYALVLSQTEYNWVALPAKELANTISKLHASTNNTIQTGLLTYELYQQLWKPLEPFIHKKRITIIPDGILYSISFDMLTSKPVKNSKELVEFSLLKKYAFSYQYSLDILNQKKTTHEKYSGISIFAPAFSETEKQDYKAALKLDSLQIDKSYLTLLPLPFSREFASKLKKSFGSTIFLGNESTISNFKKNAGNHSIIYIGTHAEANNQFPEYSRMLFAKDLETPTADNSLYLYDIYNQNLSADLAVLTACESGQSNLFPGEGMVSMAHAFNYAGSKSMLTGLWEIDERASVMITDAFYKNLGEGMSKDIALQQAKIHYLENAYGRMLAPEYWAGLIIMGDTSPIEFERNKLRDYLIVLTLLLMFSGSVYFINKRKNKKKDL